jgi:hypothetical protein
VAGTYDATDLRFGWSGDYALGEDGDLADTSDDGLESLRQELQTIAKSEINDWAVYPTYAATLSDYVGQPNTRPTANALHDRLRTAIIANGIVLESDLDIKVIPVHIHKVLIYIRVNATPTAFNELKDNRVVVSLLFDFTEYGIFFPDKVSKLTGGRV